MTEFQTKWAGSVPAPPRVYYLGSGDIAVAPLAALLADDGIELLGVGTQIDRPAGRGRRLVPTPVGAFAAGKCLTVDKIANVNAPDFLSGLRDMSPDFLVVVSFGQILRRDILSLPKISCVNVHASLLPRHRGASPVAAAILAGDDETGVSFMRMDAGLDTGPVYETSRLELTGRENAVDLELALGELAARGLPSLLRRVAAGLPPVPQDNDAATYAGKISKANGRIDWRWPAIEIDRAVRAYRGWPGASFALADGRRLRVAESVVEPDLNGAPGTVLLADKKRWIVACGEGALELLRVVPAGRNEMSGAEFLRGRPMLTGDKLPVEQ